MTLNRAELKKKKKKDIPPTPHTDSSVWIDAVSAEVFRFLSSLTQRQVTRVPEQGCAFHFIWGMYNMCLSVSFLPWQTCQTHHASTLSISHCTSLNGLLSVWPSFSLGLSVTWTRAAGNVVWWCASSAEWTSRKPQSSPTPLDDKWFMDRGGCGHASVYDW